MVSVLATVVILAPLAWLWQSSLVGKSYSVMGMGTLDYGGGPVAGHAHGATDRSITDFVVDDARKADLRVDLVAEAEPHHRRPIGPGYTVNGTSPGPTITAPGPTGRSAPPERLGEGRDHLALARIRRPAAMDGVAGVTQDEVPIGGEFTYRRGRSDRPIGITRTKSQTHR